MAIRLLGVDVDETLIASEKYLLAAEDEFLDMVEQLGATSAQMNALHENIHDIQTVNVPITGIGGVPLFYKTFMDAAAKYVPDLVDGTFVAEVGRIIGELRNSPTDMYEDAEDFVRKTGELDIPRVLITKGEIHFQRYRVRGIEEQLGLDLPSHVVGDKTPEDYRNVLRAEGVEPEEFLMIGDSVKSDIIPVVEMGGSGIHLARPNPEGGGPRWSYESGDLPDSAFRVASLTEAFELVSGMVENPKPPAAPTELMKKIAGAIQEGDIAGAQQLIDSAPLRRGPGMGPS